MCTNGNAKETNANNNFTHKPPVYCMSASKEKDLNWNINTYTAITIVMLIRQTANTTREIQMWSKLYEEKEDVLGTAIKRLSKKKEEKWQEQRRVKASDWNRRSQDKGNMYLISDYIGVGSTSKVCWLGMFSLLDIIHCTLVQPLVRRDTRFVFRW